MCLVHFCACFEQPSAHHQENQLYQYIIWYISLCVCGRLVCRSERNCLKCIPGHWVARNVYRSEINTLKKCVKLVINTNCTEMHGQQNIKFSFSHFTPGRACPHFPASDQVIIRLVHLLSSVRATCPYRF